MSTTTAPALPAATGPASPLRVPPPLSTWSILLRGMFVCALGIVLILGLAAWSLLPRGEVRALRRIALAQLSGNWERQVEVRVGGTLCSAGQLAATLAGAPPEAIAVLDCVDSAEVSVHRRTSRHDAGHDESTDLLNAAAQAMAERGWDALVRVHSHHDTVAVFLAPTSVKDRLQLCVLVHSGNDLVVAACEGRLGPLLQILNTKSFQGKLGREFGRELRREISRGF